MTVNGRMQMVPFLRLVIMLVLGIVAGDAIAMMHWLWGGIATLSLLCALLLRHKPVVQGAFLMITVAALGAWWTVVYELRQQASLPPASTTYQAVVTSTPVIKEKVVQCDLYLLSGQLHERTVKASFLRDEVAERLGVNDGVQVTSTLKTPKPFATDNHFDYVRWMQVHGYVAQTFVASGQWQPVVIDLQGESGMLRLRLSGLLFRQRLLQKLDAYQINVDAAAVAAAMTLGDKSALSAQVKALYAATGASHVLALSGMHLSVVTLLLMLVCFKKRGGRVRQGLAGRHGNVLGYLLLLTMVWAYVLVAGMPTSLMRAAVMLSLCSWGVVLGRDPVSLNSLCLTAIIMLCANPLCLWDVSFQMSFMAVAAILVLYRPLYEFLVFMLPTTLGRWRPMQALYSLWAVSLAAQIGVAPISLYCFGQFSCYFLLTNVVAVPLVSVIIPVTLLFLFVPVHGFSFLTWLSSALAALLSHLVVWLNQSLSTIAHWPGATLSGIAFTAFDVVLLYIVYLCLYIIAARCYHAYCRAASVPPKDIF